MNTLILFYIPLLAYFAYCFAGFIIAAVSDSYDQRSVTLYEHRLKFAIGYLTVYTVGVILVVVLG